MKLLKVRFGYGVVFSPEQRAILDSSCIGTVDPEWNEDGTMRNSYSCFVVDIGAMERLGTSCRAELLGVIDNAATKRLAEFGQRNTTVVNEKCSVAVAGLGLLTVDEVKACEDLCTQKLQEELDDGWRILAVCVQPDQRRPDYVLGRTRNGGDHE